MCLRLFTKNEVLSGSLTKEHVVPREVGGRTITLACKHCNNTYGSELDRHLVAAAKALDAFEGKAPIRAIIDAGNVRVRANITWPALSGEAQPVRMEIVGKASSLAAVEALPAAIYDGARLNLSLQAAFIPDRYWRSLARSAYLALFHQLGYRYAYSDAGAQARAFIDGGASPGAPVLAAHLSCDLPPAALGIPVEVADRVLFYVVLLTIRTAACRHIAVLLPGENVAGRQIMEFVAEPERLLLTLQRDDWHASVKFTPDPIQVFGSYRLR